jgi:histidine triad (HIT) family protein
MATIFSRIAARELPAYIIDENEDFLAFLDISPLMTGHTLVIPKKEVDYIFDLDNQTLAGLHVFSKRIAEAIKKAVPCERIGVTVIGLEVPHAHIHLIPINQMDDMDFGRMKLSPTKEQLAATAKKITAAL